MVAVVARKVRISYWVSGATAFSEVLPMALCSSEKRLGVIYKSLNSLATKYVKDILSLNQPSRPLRFSLVCTASPKPNMEKQHYVFIKTH